MFDALAAAEQLRVAADVPDVVVVDQRPVAGALRERRVGELPLLPPAHRLLRGAGCGTRPRGTRGAASQNSGSERSKDPRATSAGCIVRSVRVGRRPADRCCRAARDRTSAGGDGPPRRRRLRFGRHHRHADRARRARHVLPRHRRRRRRRRPHDQPRRDGGACVARSRPRRPHAVGVRRPGLPRLSRRPGGGTLALRRDISRVIRAGAAAGGAAASRPSATSTASSPATPTTSPPAKRRCARSTPMRATRSPSPSCSRRASSRGRCDEVWLSGHPTTTDVVDVTDTSTASSRRCSCHASQHPDPTACRHRVSPVDARAPPRRSGSPRAASPRPTASSRAG